MDILILQVFVSLVLVFGSILLFAVSARQRDYEHADRLALLPLEEDAGATPTCFGSPRGKETAGRPSDAPHQARLTHGNLVGPSDPKEGMSPCATR